MTTVDRPNRQKLNEGLDIFRDAMRSFLAPNLRRVRGSTIEEAVSSVLTSRWPRLEEFKRHLADGGTVQGFIDIADFRNLLLGHWDNHFKEYFKNDRAILDECKTVATARNESYHIDEHDISTTETKHTLLQISRALARINCPQDSRRVQQLHDSIVDPQTRELQAEVAQLALRVREQSSEIEVMANEIDRVTLIVDHASSAFQDAFDALAENLQEILSKITGQQDAMDGNMKNIEIALEKHDSLAELVRESMSHIEDRLDMLEEDDEDEEEEEDDEEEDDEEEDDEEEDDEEEDDEEEDDEEEDDEEEDDEDDKEDNVSSIQLSLGWTAPQLSIRAQLIRALDIMPTARFYCTVPNCRFSDGSRKAWYNDYKAYEHATTTGHEVAELPRR